MNVPERQHDQERIETQEAVLPEPRALQISRHFVPRSMPAAVGVWCWDLRSNRMTWSTDLQDVRGRPERGA